MIYNIGCFKISLREFLENKTRKTGCIDFVLLMMFLCYNEFMSGWLVLIEIRKKESTKNRNDGYDDILIEW